LAVNKKCHQNTKSPKHTNNLSFIFCFWCDLVTWRIGGKSYFDFFGVKYPLDGKTSQLQAANCQPLSGKYRRYAMLYSQDRGLCLKSFSNFIPVDHLEEGLNVFRTTVLVLQVISMFPDINPKNR